MGYTSNTGHFIKVYGWSHHGPPDRVFSIAFFFEFCFSETWYVLTSITHPCLWKAHLYNHPKKGAQRWLELSFQTFFCGSNFSLLQQNTFPESGCLSKPPWWNTARPWGPRTRSTSAHGTGHTYNVHLGTSPKMAASDRPNTRLSHPPLEKMAVINCTLQVRLYCLVLLAWKLLCWWELHVYGVVRSLETSLLSLQSSTPALGVTPDFLFK